MLEKEFKKEMVLRGKGKVTLYGTRFRRLLSMAGYLWNGVVPRDSKAAEILP